ncbi:hypothetical protein DICPUDRAFT_155420 [Dictyostelium purpureum]|uniref:Uncharacterized protein n=1 Tax=Dictyostelium purpureum TaxID=5786 RepID=F0ZTZ0_DICPU|nr:uncharacterized protein DICPUDRAFT_155420 [Dictyostelium purpureum]EGC32586.1 hypothetical protein DICPUDRAFT_155420 [Dictyostelium purpureum]|eukprot:XP_003290877.1 hypothetical protein DICPUDRAFT_155420 [Dictyostelium purpureum]
MDLILPLSTHLNLGPLKSNTINLDECTINIESIIYTADQHVLLNKFSICNKTIDPSKYLKLDLWLSHIGSIKLNDEIISAISLVPTNSTNPATIPITLPTTLPTIEINKSFENKCSHLLKNLIIQIQSHLNYNLKQTCNINFINNENLNSTIKNLMKKKLLSLHLSARTKYAPETNQC